MDFKVRGLEFIQVSAKKQTGGLDLRLGLELGGHGTRVRDGARYMVGGVNRVRDRDGVRCMVRGVNRVRDRDGVRCRVRDRDGVRADSGCTILFEKHPPPPKKVRNYLVGKN